MNDIVENRVQAIKNKMQEILDKKAKYIDHFDLVSVSAIMGYDPKLYLNWLSDALEKYPSDFSLAAELIFKATSYRNEKEMNPEIEKWVRENPEKLAKAIESFNKPQYESPLEEFYIRIGYLPDEPYIKTLPMLFLPDDVFNEHFSKIDNKHLIRRWAILVKDYFNTDWKIPAEEKTED